MAKKSERENRRAIAEQLRKQQQRKERQRSLLILGACVVLVVGLLAAALVPYVKNLRQEKKIAGTPIAELGVKASAAGCDPVQKKKASGNQQHLPEGQSIPYTDAPPAFGPHWGNFLQGSEIRPMYTPTDRPPLERLVHSLEHGHTLLWYDDTVKPGTKSYTAIKAMADKLGTASYFMVVPWTKADENGKSFPSGKHFALTHWTGPSSQEGITEYCGAASGAVVKSFMAAYPTNDAPEPGGV